MRPLHVPEILVVEVLRDLAVLVLEGVDGPVLAVEEGSPVRDLADRLAHDPAHAGSGVHRVAGVVDRALLVDVDRRGIQRRMAEDGAFHGEVRSPHEFRAEDRHRLRMGPAVEPEFLGAEVPADVGDERVEGVGRIAALRRVDLVPQVPGEDHARAAPARRGEGQPRLDGGPHGGIGQRPGRVRQGPPLRARIGMMAEVQPHPERVVGRQQDAELVLLAEREQVVPELHHVGRVAAGRVFQVPVADLGIFHHQPQHGHAVGLEHGEVPVDGRDVAPSEQGIELDPADRVVLADRVPIGPALLDEIGRPRGHADPGQGRSAGRTQGRGCRRA